ncbi:hypothetical protein GLU64_02605 [Nanohaloarchaea archaeon]|nr:hypothetical protein [Candidatus Nanohaloarchaea archaeon]
MVNFEGLQKLFHHTVNNDPIDPGRGFVNIEIDGEVVYQYNMGGLHNFVNLEEGEFSRVREFAESSDCEIMMVDEPNDDKCSTERNLTIKGEDDAEADIELFKEFLGRANFSVSDIDDAYFPIDEQGKTDIRPEDISG